MKKRSIMTVPVICFWFVTVTCLLGIIVGSFYDFSIEERPANAAGCIENDALRMHVIMTVGKQS